jgi:hypothetical protein
MLLTKPRIRMGTAFFALVAATGVSGGCASAHPGNNTHQPHKPIPPRQVIVVAPVLNLSNSTEFDTLKVTDAVASEAVGFPGIGVCRSISCSRRLPNEAQRVLRARLKLWNWLDGLARKPRW